MEGKVAKSFFTSFQHLRFMAETPSTRLLEIRRLITQILAYINFKCVGSVEDLLQGKAVLTSTNIKDVIKLDRLRGGRKGRASIFGPYYIRFSLVFQS